MPPGPGPDDPVEVPQFSHGDPLAVRGKARGLRGPAAAVRDVQIRLWAANPPERRGPHLGSENIEAENVIIIETWQRTEDRSRKRTPGCHMLSGQSQH